jgi:predicted TPR repeat methyltransferase
LKQTGLAVADEGPEFATLDLFEAVELAMETHRNGYLAEAEMLYGFILQTVPHHPAALHNMGMLHQQRGDKAKAIEYFCRATVAEPTQSKSKTLLGIAYSALGRVGEAADVYRRWLREDPENPIAEHLHAACSGIRIPERAANRYIETTFDEFAPTFDEQLLVELSYQGPALIEAALAKVLPPASNLRGLDAGCGTGLCGPVIRPYVNHLTGVDLSSRMLARARQRGGYDTLKKTELTRYLIAQEEAFDLIVMADTLIYFGALETVLAAVRDALRSGGIFIFTVEDAGQLSSSQRYRLNSQGRYSHGYHYIDTTLAECGFAISAMVSETLRTDLGSPVAGAVVTAIRSAR